MARWFILALAAQVAVARRIKTALQPELVAHSLAAVEEEWKQQADTFVECNDTAKDAEEAEACKAPASGFEKSCSKIVSAVVQASDGDRSRVSTYLNTICAQKDLNAPWKQEQCKTLSSVLAKKMSAESVNNRESFDAEGLCRSFWPQFIVMEQVAVRKERAERLEKEKKEAEEKAAKEKQEAEEKAAREAAEAAAKAAAEKAAAEAAKAEAEKKQKAEEETQKKQAAEKSAELLRHHKAKAEEAKKKAAESAVRLAQKKAEAQQQEEEANRQAKEAKDAAEEAETVREQAHAAEKQREQVHATKAANATETPTEVAVNKTAPANKTNATVAK